MTFTFVYNGLRMRIAYADDNPECLRAFEAALEIYGKQYDVSFFSYASAKDLLRDLKKTTFDAIFTDIEMKNMNGIEMMKELHRNRYDIPVIFITSHTKYVYQSFGINVLGYITKQKLDEELPVILQKIQAEIQHRRMIPFSSGSETVMIREEDILYIDRIGRKVYIHTSRGEFSVSGTLQEIYEKTDPEIFIFINRSCFVNLMHTEMIRSSDIYIEDTERPLEISRNRRQNVREAFLAHRKTDI